MVLCAFIYKQLKLQYKKAMDYFFLNKKLPDNFVDYHLANRYGFTVAHEALILDALPAWFKGCHLTDDEGYTVAHYACIYGFKLPASFNDWYLNHKFQACFLFNSTIK